MIFNVEKQTQPRKGISEKFLNNTYPNTLINRIHDIMKNEQIKYLEFIVGFFNPCGFSKIAQFLKPNHKIRILIGIEAAEIYSHLENPSKARYKESLIEFLKTQIQKDENYRFESVDSMQMLVQALNENLELRMTKNRNVHAKIYLFRHEATNSKAKGLIEYNGHLITGSSNLSESGLEGNYEFNVELKDSQDIESALAEFEALWADGVSVTPTDIIASQKQT